MQPMTPNQTTQGKTQNRLLELAAAHR
ncbi:hypothetical protein J2X90_004834 [Variovorax paradoxus]|nr:hypothetical protein [Variovorax paradoxus]